eukprot:2937788-Rhodomonas_salina.1
MATTLRGNSYCRKWLMLEDPGGQRLAVSRDFQNRVGLVRIQRCSVNSALLALVTDGIMIAAKELLLVHFVTTFLL